MYKILIVDDETIILSGIKFLIDWKKHDCMIIDTARNGKEALDIISEKLPDIVLCDIKMPVMDGNELLKMANEQYPSVVFVMLTNMQDFDQAIDALRFRAVDYLLKSQLEAEALIHSLNIAKKECDKRMKLLKVDIKDKYEDKIGIETLQEAFFQILFDTTPEAVKHATNLYLKYNMLNHYSMLFIPIDFSRTMANQFFSREDRKKLVAWEQEITANITSSIFQKNYLFLSECESDSLILYIWNQEHDFDKKMELFSQKLCNASQNIVQAHCAVFYTNCHDKQDELTQCREELMMLFEYHYLYGYECPDKKFKVIPQFQPLALGGISIKLETEINSHNASSCCSILKKAADRVQETTHKKSHAIWLCNELMGAASKLLHEGYFADKQGYYDIDMIQTKKQTIEWIEKLGQAIMEQLSQYSNSKSEQLEKAKEYVRNHIEDHITLQDAADYACISAGYLSTLFKRHNNQSFIEYVNQSKVDYACTLIQEDKYLMNEIAYKLSFENAYYFAKVFKKFMGCTPSEYQKKMNSSKFKC